MWNYTQKSTLGKVCGKLSPFTISGKLTLVERCRLWQVVVLQTLTFHIAEWLGQKGSKATGRELEIRKRPLIFTFYTAQRVGQKGFRSHRWRVGTSV